ncbi:SusC/RagA family TonB-linked outer membrane protein [Pedobacter sp. HMF7647]|uniref:SusC/RagA family TonB-linked outer membrane protein n=1 Tax=Hufsiella arboris TaxID=2695275 RepID=A0A7K1Y5L6_9SPHI|nr:TonB-dependent receptor [Hufsiella arboris]MXV49875.1 SusC/RagA family TonB-linked outer membrane protein [Hufsiella arboris]
MKKLLPSLFLLLFFLKGYGQSQTVTGTVTDRSDGTTLPGVSIKVKGTSLGTQSDASGNYRISVDQGATLVFSYIGYDTQELQANASTLNVSLTTNARQLGEVVVVAYGTQSKVKQTGAVAQVSSSAIENRPQASFDQALQGRVPGLQSIGASGQPGASQDVRIRGNGSFSASSSPLYVIDGIPVNSGDLSRNTTTANALSGINPNDIESISVLKDASAASVYGSRAANGVILVTTKSGKAGKTKIRADAEGGFSNRAYFNENTRPITTEENITLSEEGFLNNPFYVQEYDLTPDNIRDFVIDYFGYDPNVNTTWYDVVKQTGTYQQYNLSADGGNEKTQFHLSGGYFKQEGTIRTSKYDRFSGNVNLKHQYNSKLMFQANLLASSSTQVGPLNSGNFANPVLSNLFLMPNLEAYDANGEPNTSGNLANGAGLFNPAAILELDKNHNSTLKSLGSIYGEYKFLPNLKFSTKYGIDYNALEEDGYNSPLYGDGYTYQGLTQRDYSRYFNWVWTNLLDYNFNITADKELSANVKVGYEAQKSKLYTSTAQASKTPLNGNYTDPGIGATPLISSGGHEGYSFSSLLSLANVSYKDRYVVSGSFRRDGSSRFGSNNRYGNFWSVGASWNAEQESFLKDVDWITQLKLRGSYGINGNAGIGNYSWQPLYGYTRYLIPTGAPNAGSTINFVYNGNVGSGPAQIGNENLTWEKNKAFDVAIDAAFLKSRITTTVDWYTRKSTNLLSYTPISATTGFTSYLDNIGAMKNQGIEVSLTGVPVQTKDLKLELYINYSYNKNEVTSLVNDKQISTPFIRQVGEDYQSYYLRLWAGVDPANGDPLWYTDGTRSATTNNYNAAQRALTGKKASPAGFGSFGTNVSYKGISLDAMFYYSYGSWLYDPYYQYLNSGGYYNGSYNQRATELNRWQKPGDLAPVPRIDYDGTNSYQVSDRILTRGDYIRLRDVTLGYDFPKALVQKAKLNNLRIFVRGTNLVTFTRDKNLPYDPEAGGASGLTDFDIDVPRTWAFGLNVGL